MTGLDPPLQTLFGRAPDDLPEALSTSYGGGLGLARSALYANFVATIDGIAAIADVPASSKIIGGQDEGDRFVMALLRASADAVLTGAGTFRQHRGPWTAPAIVPGSADAFAELRRREGRSESPVLAIVTASGEVEPKPGQETIVLTTEKGAPSVPAGFSEVLAIGDPSSTAAPSSTALVIRQDDLVVALLVDRMEAVLPVGRGVATAATAEEHPAVSHLVTLDDDGGVVTVIDEAHLTDRLDRLRFTKEVG